MLQKRGHRINRMSWKSESSKTTACAPAWGKVVAAGVRQALSRRRSRAINRWVFPQCVFSSADFSPPSLLNALGARTLALPAHSSFITKPGHWPSSLPLSVSVVSVIVALVFTLLARLCFFFSCSSVPYLPVFVCPTLTPLSRCRVGSLWPLHAVFPRGAERL